MPVDIEAKIEGRYVMPEMDEIADFDMDSNKDSMESHTEISLVGAK